jgi:hypothetical protein
MFNPSYAIEGFAALVALDGFNPDRLRRSVGIVIPLKVEGFAALSELDGLNPDRLLKSVGMT